MNAQNKILGTRYVIITPVRDEAQYVEETIKSVISQTVLPAEWVIVDDGSTDATSAILDRYSSQFPWIKVIHRQDRGSRLNGSGVMHAFYDGLGCIRTRDWAYLAKLDGDLRFAPDYFEKCFEEFRNDPKLGIGGGVVADLTNHVSRMERGPAFHVRGATKIYRRGCWDSIGGLLKSTGWDTADELKANMAGWRTRSFECLRVLHHRPTGSAEGAWCDAVKNGHADYICGYHPVFMLFKCGRRIFEKPFVIQAAGLFRGYFGAYLRRAPRVADYNLIRYVRKQQLNRLVFLDSIWK